AGVRLLLQLLIEQLQRPSAQGREALCTRLLVPCALHMVEGDELRRRLLYSRCQVELWPDGHRSHPRVHLHQPLGGARWKGQTIPERHSPGRGYGNWRVADQPVDERLERAAILTLLPELR